MIIKRLLSSQEMVESVRLLTDFAFPGALLWIPLKVKCLLVILEIIAFNYVNQLFFLSHVIKSFLYRTGQCDGRYYNRRCYCTTRYRCQSTQSSTWTYSWI